MPESRPHGNRAICHPSSCLNPAPQDPTMTLSLRSAVDLVSNPRNLDASVDEVFRLMVGGPCTRSWQSPPPEVESVTAVVGFGGILTGACVLRCGARAACAIAGGMTGGHFDVVDDIVKDAIGEI